MHDQPMEEEKVVENNQAQSSSPIPAGLPINWGLITGPVQPVLPAPSLSTQLPPPQSTAVHALQTKVKSIAQRRVRGRDRERERERERLDADVLVSYPTGQISSEVLLRQTPREKAHVPLSAHSWRSGAGKILSSSEEEEEVEVEVKLEIHSPPAGVQREKVLQEEEDSEEGRSEKTEGQPCGLGEGTSLESLLSDNSSSSKDDPATPPSLPVFSSVPSPVSASTTSSNFTSTSSTSTRHWAPPRGFWRVARPETLLLNGVGPNNIPSTLLLKDHTQTEAPAGPQRKSKPAETGKKGDVGNTVDDSDASSEFKHSDSVECFLYRCEQKEIDSKGLCSSDSWESISSQSGVLSANEKLKVKQRAYARLRERQHNYREERELSEGESTGHYEDTTHRVDCKGRSIEVNVFGNQWV